MDTQKHPLPTSASKLVPTATLVLLALASAAGRAQAQTEASPPAEAPASAPADEGTATAPAGEAVKPALAEAPKCNCPPPCPAPPPPPPAPPVNPIEWKAQSKGGMLVTSGNSQSKNFSFGVNGFRKEGNNKLTLEGGLAYGTSNVMVANVAPATGTTPPTIISLDRQQTTSTNNMAAKGRYDRFLTENNTLYASGQAAADKIAGKTFFGGGQFGYSRQLVNNKWNILVAELGYDFSYERYVQQPDKTLDPVAIHSARVLLGETLSISKQTGVTASVEALFNLNKETKASNADTGNTGVNAFKDTRLNAKIGLSTDLWKQLSFGFSFSLKYDENPAARPVPKGAPAGTAFPANYVSWAYADKVDTLTEATLIYTFF
jgi:hypothetical protein